MKPFNLKFVLILYEYQARYQKDRLTVTKNNHPISFYLVIFYKVYLETVYLNEQNYK